MANKLNLTWRDVFNTNKLPHMWHISKYLPIILKTGYKYFSWNGKVVEILESEIGNCEVEIYPETNIYYVFHKDISVGDL